MRKPIFVSKVPLYKKNVPGAIFGNNTFLISLQSFPKLPFFHSYGLFSAKILLFSQKSFTVAVIKLFNGSSSVREMIRNLRSTTKFTTTTSVDWEKTGPRTSVLAGKRKLKMQSVDDDDTECKQKCKTVMFVRKKVFCNGVF